MLSAFTALAVLVLFVAVGNCALHFLMAALPPEPEAAVDCSVRVGGRDRTFLVYAPPGRPASAPALLLYPGSAETAVSMRRRLSPAIERFARERGFVAAWMQGVGSHFNDCRRLAPFSARREGVDDVAFTRAAVEDLVSEFGVERSRVFAFGYSNGGHMAFRLAFEAPDLIAGLIAVAASVPEGEDLASPAPNACLPPAVLILGERDPINPVGGGRVSLFGWGYRGRVLSADASARWLGARNGGRTRLVKIPEGGHSVPQAAFGYPRILGGTLRDDAILESAVRLLLES